MTLKLRKCYFFQPSVDYLGYVIQPTKLQVAAYTVKDIRKARPQGTHTELRSFLVLCNVHRRFVPVFAKIAASLNEMLKKKHSSGLQKPHR